MKTINVGVVGCGKISPAYLNGCGGFNIIKVVACADLNRAVAEARAKEFNIPKVLSVEQLLHDSEVEIVVNLTIPAVHAELNLAALAAGKHAYTEKPFAVTREQAKPVLAAAKKKKLRVGSAPDTFFGGGIQTCRKLIDDGAIGQPVAATAFMVGRGPEHWHPSPTFYYQPGGGPMLDMGPYYLTALVNLLGPIRRVTASTKAAFTERTILSQPLAGQKVTVEVPTHYAGVMDFVGGATGTIIMSFDCFGGHSLPRIEIYGTAGTLSVPDPNGFKGPVKLWKKDAKEWTEVPLTHGYIDNLRGIGVADMAYAMQSGRDHRASGELAFHVLDAMQAFEEASVAGKHITLKSTCVRPASLPVGLVPGTLDT
jgi:predicted dehydrogenase